MLLKKYIELNFRKKRILKEDEFEKNEIIGRLISGRRRGQNWNFEQLPQLQKSATSAF